MDDSDARPITDGIRKAIREDGRTPFELAKLANIGPQQLYRFLNGKRGLSLEILDKLALLVGVEVRKAGDLQPLGDQNPSSEDDPEKPPVPHRTVRAVLAARGIALKPFSKPPLSSLLREGPRQLPPPSKRGLGYFGAPGMKVPSDPDASDRRRARAINARRAGQRRRKQIEGFGPSILELYRSLHRLERPDFYRMIDALFGYDLPGPHSIEWSLRASYGRDLVEQRPEVVTWLWGIPTDRRIVACRALTPTDVPLDQASFSRWAEGLAN